MRTDRIRIGTADLVISRPQSPERLIDEERFDDREFLPYWAELWPSGVALAGYVAGLALAGRSVLELGCGLGLPSLAAARAGGVVLATDWAPEAVELVAANAARNGIELATGVLAWDEDADQRLLGRFDVVLAADVLYEERNARPLLVLLDRLVASEGAALIADPGRRHAQRFFAEALARGWAVDQVAAMTAGGISRLTRTSRVTPG